MGSGNHGFTCDMSSRFPEVEIGRDCQKFVSQSASRWPSAIAKQVFSIGWLHAGYWPHAVG